MQEEQNKPKMADDWDKDKFPTSAKPIFRSGILLVITITAFCTYLYYSSEHPQEKAQDAREEQIRTDLLADGQAAVEEGNAEGFAEE